MTIEQRFLNTFGIDLDVFVSMGTFDITKFDRFLTKQDPEYDGDKCTYQDRTGYSMAQYITEKFGKDACILIILLF